jgi:N-acyl-D-amino-acid deacylase
MRGFRSSLGVVAAIVLLAAYALSARAAQEGGASGVVPPALVPIDRAAERIRAKYGIPGMAVGVMKGGRLVMARGYGYADVERRRRVEADSLFRLASVSKVVTATAVDKLVELGKLRYETRVFEVLSRLTPLTGSFRDPRLNAITVEHLINHKSGWADDIGGNRFSDVRTAATQLREPLPGTFAGLIRYEMARPLDYTPGAESHYCNFCYGVLAEVVQTAARKDYERFVIDELLRPIGVTRVRVGSHRVEGRFPGEVAYYDAPKAERIPSMYADTPGLVPAQYGGFTMDWGTGSGAGAWIGSTVDMLRLVASVTLGVPPIFAKPPRTGYAFSGLPIGRGWFWRHDGSLPGTATTLHIADDMAWCILTNSSSGGLLINELDKEIEMFAKTITDWPNVDYFATYLPVAQR